jgi:hypothetical protein
VRSSYELVCTLAVSALLLYYNRCFTTAPPLGVTRLRSALRNVQRRTNLIQPQSHNELYHCHWERHKQRTIDTPNDVSSQHRKGSCVRLAAEQPMDKDSVLGPSTFRRGSKQGHSHKHVFVESLHDSLTMDEYHPCISLKSSHSTMEPHCFTTVGHVLLEWRLWGDGWSRPKHTRFASGQDRARLIHRR